MITTQQWSDKVINTICYIVTAVILLLAQGCCVIEELEFDILETHDAVLNQEYLLTITTRIKNTPFDDNYDYDLDYNGDLPEGLEIILDEKNRRFIVQGTPVQLGTYKFTLKASANDQYADVIETDNLLLNMACELQYYDEHTYTLNVLVM